jgi:uncharacterized protein (DUF1330 family)
MPAKQLCALRSFIAEYPGGGAFLAMVTDPEYRELVKHRQAAVADPGKGFGE